MDVSDFSESMKSLCEGEGFHLSKMINLKKMATQVSVWDHPDFLRKTRFSVILIEQQG